MPEAGDIVATLVVAVVVLGSIFMIIVGSRKDKQ